MTTHQRVIDVKDYGAQPNVASDQAPVFNAAITAAKAAKLPVYAEGTYQVNTAVSLKGATEFSNATLNVYGNIGMVTGATIANEVLNLPRLVCKTKTTAGVWTAGSYGAYLDNLTTCQVYVPYIEDFETNLLLRGTGSKGHVYNTYRFGTLWNAKSNLVLSAYSGLGWCNSNLFQGGRFGGDPAEGVAIPGTSQIKLSGSARPNTNTFQGISLEGSMHYYKIDDAGGFNVYDNLRFETALPQVPRIVWRETSYYNEVRGGNQLHSLDVTTATGSVKCVITNPWG